MKRNIENLKTKKYDLLVIGGGITGCCVAHDAALRGLSVVLVEMMDFGWATSSATSKLIHGGLRYLKNLEFGLVRESLRERRTMEIIAPHLVYPIPFLVPTYLNSSNRRIIIYPGMLLYDILSYDKGNVEDPSRKMPHFKILSKEQVIEAEPDVNQNELTGGAIYYDCQMYSSERLTLEFILTATSNGADAFNYMKVTELLKKDNQIVGAKVIDLLSNETIDIEATTTVNVSGPWADFVSGLGAESKKNKIVRSEGIHILTRRLIKSHAVVYRTATGRHFFMVPWRDKTLIGTTDTRYDGSPNDYCVSKANVLEFIDEINEAHPLANLTIDDVEYCYGGLRPIVEQETDIEVEVYNASRKYEVYDHEELDNVKNFFTVIGGKYTTSRALAEELVSKVYDKLDIEKVRCTTERAPLLGGNFKDYDSLLRSTNQYRGVLTEEQFKNILNTYGAEYHKILSYVQAKKEMGETVFDGSATLMAQVAHAVENEMAITMNDVIYRRTSIGMLGLIQNREDLETISMLMAQMLGWDEEKRQEEIDQVWKIASVKGILRD